MILARSGDPGFSLRAHPHILLGDTMKPTQKTRQNPVRRQVFALFAVLLLTSPLWPAGVSAQAPGLWLVTNTNDSGPGSLRQAIISANANRATPQAIEFRIPTSDPGFDGSVFTIQPLSELPILLGNITIDGATQTAFTGDTNPLGPEVVLNGARLAAGSGIHISGDNNTVAGLVINGFQGGNGITVGYGRDSTPSLNRIRGNFIGTNAAGSLAAPNVAGIGVQGWGSPGVQAADNVIEHNLISSNTGSGINLCDAARTSIRSNLIGVDRTGALPLGNGFYGVVLTCAGAPSNHFEDNTIAYNTGGGILDQPDYRYWGSWTVDGHQGLALRRNRIFANDGLGLNLLPAPFGFFDTVTPNDPGDADTGANLLQNFPILVSASVGSGGTTVAGTLNSTPLASFEIELFGNAALDPSGYGEGETYLGMVAVTTDAAGNAAFSTVLPVAVPGGSFVTATATDAAGNTSEFSAGVPVVVSNQSPSCSGARPSVATIWLPNHSFVSVRILDVTDPDGDPVAIQIDSIWQDEPVDTRGDGQFTPDGRGLGTEVAEVRAERDGTPKAPGDGRVYHIGFTANDGRGGACSGVVQVAVPHDQNKPAIDGGALYDSTTTNLTRTPVAAG